MGARYLRYEMAVLVRWAGWVNLLAGGARRCVRSVGRSAG
jgi:hypothetical protein